MRYAFSGTRRLGSSTNVERVRTYLRSLGDGKEFTTGGSWGFDVIAADELITEFPLALHRIVIPDGVAYHKEAVWDLQERGAIVVVAPPADHKEHAYRKRNKMLVEFADELYAFPSSGERRFSGTWMTVGIAEREGIPFVVKRLDQEW